MPAKALAFQQLGTATQLREVKRPGQFVQAFFMSAQAAKKKRTFHFTTP